MKLPGRATGRGLRTSPVLASTFTPPTLTARTPASSSAPPAMDCSCAGRLTTRLCALPCGTPQCRHSQFGRSLREAEALVVCSQGGERPRPISATENQAGIGPQTESTSCFARHAQACQAYGHFLREVTVYMRGRAPRCCLRPQTPASSLWSVLAAGNRIFFTGDKEVRELARYDARLRQFVPYLAGIRARDVSFSRDAQLLTYVTTTAQESILWRSKVDGSERKQLTFAPMVSGSPRWSPDGKQIVSEARVPGKPSRIFLVSSEGGETEPVTSLNYEYPDSSPNGDSLFLSVPSPAPLGMIGADHPGIYQFDLKTRPLSILPGSERLRLPLGRQTGVTWLLKPKTTES